MKVTEYYENKVTIILQISLNLIGVSSPFKRRPHEMVRHTQTIRLSVSDGFVGLELKGLMILPYKFREHNTS